MRVNVKERAERARELFHEGYNCCQSVLLAYADVYGLEEELAKKLSCSFGGGMGRMREVCGTCSAMFMLAGMELPSTIPGDAQSKMENYALVQELAEDFKKETGSIICRDMLKLNGNTHEGPIPEPRTDDYYKRRPCSELVYLAAEIYGNKINNK